LKAWMALVLMAVTGCTGHVCNCPEDGCDFSCSKGTAEVLVPAGLPAVSSATADGSCAAAMYDPAGNRVLLTATSAGVCNVHVQLVDGSIYAAHVQLTKFSTPCACYLGAATDAVLAPGSSDNP
jgi:hypothetical protein